MHRLTSLRPGYWVLVLFVILSGNVRAQENPSDMSSRPDSNAKAAGRMITLSDFGAEDLAYLAIPSSPPTVGIVLVPDAYGLDDFTKAEADRLAGLGYLVVAVDIYNGHLTTGAGEIANMVANMNSASVMKTLNGGVRLFRESPKFKVDHVIVMGWGTGANYVLEAARDSKNIDGAILFYGPIETKPERVKKFSVPLCAVYPEVDSVATHDNVTAFQRMMKDAGNDFSAWFIAAGRGWSNPTSKAYNAAEDKEAWKVVMPFIVRIGAEPVKPKDDSLIDKAKSKFDSIFK